MTHFYFELAKDGTFKDVEKIQKYFSNKFPENSIVKEKNIAVCVADFLKNNYQVTNSKKQLEVQISKIKYPKLSSENINEDNYSPKFIFNKENNDLVINTNIFGDEYIYVAVIDDEKIVLSLKFNTKLLDRLDYNAIIEYLFSHAIFGSKTLFKDIKLMPSNSIITIKKWTSNANKTVLKSISKKKNRYQFPKKYNNEIDLESSALNIASDLKNLISKYIDVNYGKIAFLLTGGLDSRILVSTIPIEHKEDIEAYTYDCHEEGREIRNAREVTKLLNLKHKTVTINEDDIIQNSFRHMWYSEGVSNHIIGIRLKLINEMPKKVIVVDGFLGDGQFGGSYSDKINIFARKSKSTAKNLLAKLVAQELAFPKRIFYRINKAGKEDINKILLKGLGEQVQQLWPVEDKELQLECLVAQARARNYMIGSVRSVNYISKIVTPYAHPEIMSKYLEVHHKYRKGRNFELFTLSKINNEAAIYQTTSLIWYNRMATTKFVQFGFKLLVIIIIFLQIFYMMKIALSGIS
ncbi:MAG: asparagine synthase-related protein [Candidatus Heimdallarchaeota archaeon]